MDLSVEGKAGDELRELARFLVELRYTTTRLRELLELTEPVEEILSNVGRFSFFYLSDLALSAAPEAILFQLFFFSGRASKERFERLPSALHELLWRRGFVEDVPEEPGQVRGALAISEYRGRHFLSDALFENLGTEFVVRRTPSKCMPLHASSLELIQALEKPPSATASFLDVGCGSGCQSILLASQYGRLAGFDVNARAVDFARANAALNGVTARYDVADFASFVVDEVYDHVAFNAVHEAAFAFIASALDRVLAPAGCAQVWSPLFVTRAHVGPQPGGLRADLANLLRAEAPELSRFDVAIATNPDSPFSISRAQVAARTLPKTSLLLDSTAKKEDFFRDLHARGVVEVVSTVLTIRRRPGAA